MRNLLIMWLIFQSKETIWDFMGYLPFKDAHYFNGFDF